MNTKTLSPTCRSRSSPCASPEFEFWMVRNPSFPPPNILTADQLIVNGVLLPLHLLNKPDPPNPPKEPDPSPAVTDSPGVITDSTVTTSKRWKDIFRKSNKKNDVVAEEKKKEKKNNSVTTSAELNINIWPFSRSRSAGNVGTRPKLFAPAARKANSAPCSRSNSAGDSKSRKWPTSPARPGVHLGRTSPVWQVRRPKNNNNNNPESLLLNSDKSKRRNKLAGGGNGTAKTRVLNLNVPMCIGYRHHLSCRSDENSAIGVSGSHIRGNSNSNNSKNSNTVHANIGGKLFNLRNLFSIKKTVVASH